MHDVHSGIKYSFNFASPGLWQILKNLDTGISCKNPPQAESGLQ
jgi:hypothetical protein